MCSVPCCLVYFRCLLLTCFEFSFLVYVSCCLVYFHLFWFFPLPCLNPPLFTCFKLFTCLLSLILSFTCLFLTFLDHFLVYITLSLFICLLSFTGTLVYLVYSSCLPCLQIGTQGLVLSICKLWHSSPPRLSISGTVQNGSIRYNSLLMAPLLMAPLLMMLQMAVFNDTPVSGTVC